MAERRSGRSLAVAVMGGLGAGGLAFWGVSRSWARVDVAATGLPRTVVETLGTSVVPAVGALALVVVTGSLALLPTGGRVRQGVAALVTLASLGVVLGCALAGGAIGDQVLADVSANAVAAGTDAGVLAAGAEHPPWRWVTLAGGLAGMAVGAWAWARSASWAVMGSRYETPAPTAAARADRDPAELPETDMWRALDRGDDPT